MNRLQERELPPGVLLFHMAMSLIHPHAVDARPMQVAASGDRLLAGLKWHMLQIADQQRNNAFPFLPGS